MNPTEKETIVYNEKHYELKYSERTIETIEAVTKRGFMDTIANSNGLLSLSSLRQYFVQALYAVDGGKMSPEHATSVYEAVLREKGFGYVNQLVIVTIQRDCPFFFLGN